MKKVLPIFLFTFLTAQLFSQNYYTVKFPDDITVTGCGASVPATNPDIIFQGTCSFGVGISIKDQVFYTNDTKTCGKIFRRFRLLYWCDYDPNWPSPYLIYNPQNSDIGPTVVGNAQNHGYLEYTQVIKFLDNQPPVFKNCPSSTVVFCDFSENDPNQWHSNHIDQCEGRADLKVKVTDACSKSNLMLSYLMWLDLNGDGTMETFVKSADATAWPIETVKIGDTLSAQVKFPTGFELPYGKHKIEWIANDNCGNQAICKYDFQIKDCKQPTVVCLFGLSVNIMPTGMITLWASDFLKYALDNCTPANQLKIAIRKKGTGTGFPTGQVGVTFDCKEIGKQFVEIWAADAAGNAAFCETFVNVQDPFGDCPTTIINNSTTANLKGTVATDLSEPLPGVEVWFKKADPAAQINLNLMNATDLTGLYNFSNISACDGELLPTFDAQKTAGITSTDLILLVRVLDGTHTLSTPYRQLAADMDCNGKIDYDDLNEMVQVIINPDLAFQKCGAWQFLPKNFVFLDPKNAFATPIPNFEKIICSGDMTLPHDFIAIKKGDLDGSVGADFSSSKTDNRENEQAAVLEIIEKVLGKNRVQFFTARPNPTVGGQTEIPFFLAEPSDVHFTLTDSRGVVLEKTTQNFSAGNQNWIVNLRGRSGLFFIEMQGGGQRKVQRIVSF